jgi:NADH-quinone oxidoreductase subunit E
MYNQNQSVSICLNFVKHHPGLNGTEDLMDYTCEKLGVQLEITADGLLK